MLLGGRKGVVEGRDAWLGSEGCGLRAEMGDWGRKGVVEGRDVWLGSRRVWLRVKTRGWVRNGCG